jgi:hypothetical protein
MAERKKRKSDRSGRPPMRSPGRPTAARREDQQRFWAAIARGLSSEDAAAGAGASPAVGVRWFRQGGGMPSISMAPVSGRYLTVEEQLVATNATTQVHRVLAALDIRSISAHSPQAKGRIEWLFATLQDRLVAELRLADITTCAGANTLLATFLPRYNTQFGVPARELGRAYRPLERGCDLEQICCFVYYRTVAADNTVRLGEHRIQIQPGPGRMSYAKTRVEVQERLDGALAVYYQGQCLATKAAPEEAPVLRARATGRPAPGQSEITRPVVAAAEGVGMLAVHIELSATMDDPGRQHIHAPRIPGPAHPFRLSYKTIRRTKSLDD